MLNTLQVHDTSYAGQTSPDLLDRGFRLALFIFPDRAIALQILRNAMSKLKVHRTREEKRIYWRDKNLKRKITKTVRTNVDALQWLIYCESTFYEKEQEQSAEPTMSDMVVRYVKYLTQVTTAMSAFYVNVGQQRILHTYRTADTQKYYEYITGHCPGTAEYRRIKRVLMKQLEERFSSFLRMHRTNHGERRFEACQAQSDWVDLVDECLREFTPWSTEQACTRVANLSSTMRSLAGHLLECDNQETRRDLIEAYRCHMFIDPVCYGRLSARLGMDSPYEQLAVPRFYLNNKSNDDQSGDSHMQRSTLTEAERKGILDELRKEAWRRRDVVVSALSIVVDGEEYATFDLDSVSKHSFKVQEGAKLVEIWVLGQGERVLAATHWIDYTECHGIAEAKAVATLGDGKEIVLDVVPLPNEDENAGGAFVSVKCRPVSRFARLIEYLLRFRSFRLFPKVAVAVACLLAIIGFWGMETYRSGSAKQQTAINNLNLQLAANKAQVASLQERLSMKPDVAGAADYRLTPESFATRGGGDSQKEQVVPVPPGATLVTLKLPVSNRSGSYHAVLKSFVDNRELLSESSLHPLPEQGTDVVTLAVPSSFLKDREYYVIDLYLTTRRIKPEKVALFTFHVSK